MKKPCTFEIANVLMMKSENGSFVWRVTLMPPYVSEPSSGQYWAHFFCIMLHNVQNGFKRNNKYCAPIRHKLLFLLNTFCTYFHAEK